MLFLETYLDTPIEQALALAFAPPVVRSGVEVGNLAVVDRGGVRLLFSVLTAFLYAAKYEWVVFTVGPLVVNTFLRLGLPLTDLGPARPERLSASERLAWGSYYDQKPHVMAGRVAGKYSGFVRSFVGGGIGSAARFAGRRPERLRGSGCLDPGRGDRRFATQQPDAEARRQIIEEVLRTHGPVDVLINTAGLLSYRPFAEKDPALLERIVQFHTLVPMLLARQLLPAMIERGEGKVVNVGSTFGSIVFAWFAAYSTSKFALRGFSEALRRELDGIGVGVSYIAPRAVKTAFNTPAVYQIAEATGMNMDSPEWVAKQIVASILKDRKEVYLGFPESLFVRINALLPRVVDVVLRKQNQKMMAFVKRGET